MESAEYKILIVETDTLLIEQIKKVVTPLFSEVLVAHDSTSAASLYLENEPDLVLANNQVNGTTGIDMANNIRKDFKWARVILYGDSHESKDFLTALDRSIKGFLLKPLDEDQLRNIIQKQIAKINRFRTLKSEEDKRKIVEQKYDKSKRILQVISQTTALFFRTGYYERNINKVLELIGKVTEASRVYVYKNFVEQDEEYTSRIYEWAADGIMPAIGNLAVTKRHIASSGFERWVKVMKQDKNYISGFIRNFSLTEQKILEEHSIRSILALPIFVENKWWGFIGLDDCLEERSWTEAEIAALEVLANNLGLAIHKNDTDEEILRLNRELEQKIRERTRDLEFEIAEAVDGRSTIKG